MVPRFLGATVVTFLAYAAERKSGAMNPWEKFLSEQNKDQQGENAFFEFLFERFSVIVKYKLRGEDADDIVQEACEVVFKKFSQQQFSDSDGFKRWAYKILKNKIGTHLTKNKRESKHFRKGEIDLENFSGRKGHDGLLKERVLLCLHKMANKKPDYFIVLKMIFEGYSVKKISEKLGTTKNNVYVILYRARKMLKNCLESGWIK